MGVAPDHAYWMGQALQCAHQAEKTGEVPVGAVLIKDDQLISKGWNQPISQHDPCAHAEIITLRQAGKIIGNYRLTGASLYVTLEPCAMCVGAMIHARISHLIFAAFDPKTGAAGSVINLFEHPISNHKTNIIGGVLQARSAQLLTDFFTRKRK